MRKHACVATNTGWFSERSAAYLASGRPASRHARYGLQRPSAMWARALRRAHRGGGTSPQRSMRSTPTGGAMRAGAATSRASIWTPNSARGHAAGAGAVTWPATPRASRQSAALERAQERATTGGSPFPCRGLSAPVPRSTVGRAGIFHDGGGAVPVGPHQEQASVERTQRRAMAHTEYRVPASRSRTSR